MKYCRLIKILVLITLIYIVKNDSVCDEKTLKMELKQDIDDNGILDCLRTIMKPHNYEETAEEYNKRILAQWDTECSFEAQYDWMKTLREEHGISNLVDDSGDVVEKDFDNQADMCEIIRAAIAAGKFAKITTELINIPVKVFDEVDCVGDNRQTKICAVTGSSFFQKDTWFILLDGMQITVKDEPRFIKTPEKIQLPDIPESDNKKDDAAVEEEEQVQLIDMTKIFSTENIECAKVFNTGSNLPFEGVDLKANFEEESILLLIGTFTGEFMKKDDHINIQLLLNGKVEKDTKTMVGDVRRFSLTDGFVFKCKTGENVFNMQYNTKGIVNKVGKHCPDNGVDGRNLQMLEISGSNQFHRFFEEEEFQVKKSEKWSPMSQLTKKVEILGDKMIMIFYSFGVNSSGKFGCRISIDNTAQPQSTFITHNSPDGTAFGWAILETTAGEHTISVEYISDIDFPVKPNEPGQNAALSVVTLPKSTIEVKSITESVTIESKEWARLSNELDLKMNLKKRPNHALFIYRINFSNPDRVIVHLRLLINDKEIIQCRSSSLAVETDSAIGQCLVKLEKGKQKVVLQYQLSGESKIEIVPTDFGGASLQVLSMEILQK